MCSSVVERCPDKTEVVGPIPTTRTLGFYLSYKKTPKPKFRGFVYSHGQTQLLVWLSVVDSQITIVL